MIKKNFLKILILCIIVLMLESLYTNVYATTNENSEKSQLVNINLDTGDILIEDYIRSNQSRTIINRTEHFIPENVRGLETRAIVGDKDEREIVPNTNVFPYSTICFLESTFPDGTIVRSTGFLIYKDLVLTAGHCVYYSEYGGQATSIKVVPGKNGVNEPFGYTWVTNITCDVRWFESMNVDEDWSLLKLSYDIGSVTGWLGIAFSYDYSFFANGQSVRVTGYPDVLNKGYRQYTMRAPVVQANDMHLIYEVDTEKGQSGSPVFEDSGYAIGIHSKITEINGVIYNQSSNITRDRFNTFVSQMN